MRCADTAVWNVRGATLVLDQVADPIGIAAFVGENMGFRRQIVQQQFSHWRIIGATG
jgi:hypothetical protein